MSSWPSSSQVTPAYGMHQQEVQRVTLVCLLSPVPSFLGSWGSADFLFSGGPLPTTILFCFQELLPLLAPLRPNDGNGFLAFASPKVSFIPSPVHFLYT